MAFLLDTLTDTDGTALESHSGETGANWTLLSGGAGAMDIRSNRARAASSAAIYQASGIPSDPEYDIEIEFVRVGALVANQQIAAVGRWTDANNYYFVDLLTNAIGTGITVRLFKRVAGANTNLGFFNLGAPAVGSTTTVNWEIRNAAKKVFVNGTERISVADNALTAAGRVNVFNIGAATGTGTGIQIDSITAANLFVPVTGAELDLPWDLRAEATGAELELPWDLRTAIESEETFVWDLRTEATGPGLDLPWDLAAERDASVDAVWDLLAETTADELNLPWDLRTEASGDQLEMLWDLRAASGAELDLLWDLRAAVAADELELLWDLAAEVASAPQFLLWDLEVGPGPVNGLVQSLIWDLRADTDGPVLDLPWDLRTPVDGPVPDFLWDLRGAADGAVLDLLWDLRGVVDSPVIRLLWDLQIPLVITDFVSFPVGTVISAYEDEIENWVRAGRTDQLQTDPPGSPVETSTMDEEGAVFGNLTRNRRYFFVAQRSLKQNPWTPYSRHFVDRWVVVSMIAE